MSRGFGSYRRRHALACAVAVGLAGSPIRAAAPVSVAAAPSEESSSTLREGTTPSETFVPGIPTWVPVKGDKPALVVHGPSDSSLAIVYLHGLCGNVRAIESFSAASSRYGTVIALLGDRGCPGGRFKWGKNIEAMEQRVDLALDAVKRVRDGKLDSEHPVLFGYSQGAAKAEQLVARYPEKYRMVVLGGPPREPKLPLLGAASAVAVLGGERETTGHMRAGAEVLAAAGRPARFFLLPAAKHGEFGPEGNRIVGDLLGWLLATGSDS